MLLLHNDSVIPAWNLALEEYLLTQTKLEIIVLWRNSPSVIIGRNQNALEEIDAAYVRENAIDVIRRQSGGGAVFHDLGNINFTVIHALGQSDFNNYSKFTQPVCEFLNTLGIKAYLHGRNDLLIGGMKFSGNAQAVRGGRIMHHGTLLYNADVGRLAGALRPNPAKIQSKAVASVRSRVTNIAAHLECASPPPAEDFLSGLYEFYRSRPDMREYKLTEADREATDRLAREKYSSWDWNFGKSPDYTYKKYGYFPAGGVSVSLSAKNAAIKDIAIRGDFFGMREISVLESALRGIPHERAAIQKALESVKLGDYIAGITPDEFLSLF
ncbi:MAG: lipoate--protein ligase [Oscillospiraceae bacterium]|nr:lipoate--protein ligase [Oscillospiraceae bacterium]